MSEPTVIASRQGSVTEWLPPVVSALGDGVAATHVTDAPEDNQYHVPESLLEAVADTVERADCTRLVVDGDVHPGQAVDLRTRVPAVEVRDRRQVVYERLAGANPVAGATADLERARVALRAARRQQRTEQTQSPDGTSGRVADLEQRCETLRADLAAAQQTARRRVETAHTDADARVVILRRAGRPAPLSRRTVLDSEQAGAKPAADGLNPARPETVRAQVGPHDVAVTDVPGVCWDDGIPEWFETVTPGTVAALERADVVVGGRPSGTALLDHAAERFDADSVVVETAKQRALVTALADALPTVDIAATLPYSDEAQAAVSWLYDRTAVQDVTYDDRIELAVTASEATADAVARRLEDAGGQVERSPGGPPTDSDDGA